MSLIQISTLDEVNRMGRMRSQLVKKDGGLANSKTMSNNTKYFKKGLPLPKFAESTKAHKRGSHHKRVKVYGDAIKSLQMNHLNLKRSQDKQKRNEPLLLSKNYQNSALQRIQRRESNESTTQAAGQCDVSDRPYN